MRLPSISSSKKGATMTKRIDLEQAVYALTEMLKDMGRVQDAITKYTNLAYPTDAELDAHVRELRYRATRR